MTNKNEVSINQKQVTSNILDRIEEMKTEGLAIPRNYNPSNALNIAFLELKDMKVRSRPLLEAVTRDSIYQSLLNMVLQGLSPAKNQVYFIPYGNELQMQRSYFGTQAVLKRLSGVKDIWADVIRKGEVFEFTNEDGRKRLTKHEQSFETLDNEMIGAYAVIDTEEEGKILEVMTKKQIDASWSQARSKNVHNKFGDQMAMRTVINRAAKNYINTSDDSDLLIHAINATTENEYDDEESTRDVTPEKKGTSSLIEELKAEKEQPEEDEKEDENTPIEESDVIDGEFEEVEEHAEVNDEKTLTVYEIKEFLDKNKVDYPSKAKKPELERIKENFIKERRGEAYEGEQTSLI